MLPSVTIVSVPPRKPCFSTSRTDAPSLAAATAAASPAEPPPTTSTSTWSASCAALLVLVMVLSSPVGHRPGSGSALGGCTGGAHRLAPFVDFGTDVGCEFVRAVADNFGTEAGQLLLHVPHGQDADQFGVVLPNDRLRRAGRREHPAPGCGLEILQSLLGEGRQVRQGIGPVGGGNADRP